MRASTEVHDGLARLLEYPKSGWLASAEEAASCIGKECPAALEALEPFLQFVRATPQGDLEESFTRTFDNSEECALEAGWHVFGENYTRGSFMAGMRRQLREAGVEENGELPDHFSHLFALLGRQPEDRARLLALEIVAPAMRKVHLALDKMESPWRGVLGAGIEILAMHAPEARTIAPAVTPQNDPTACDSFQEERHV